MRRQSIMTSAITETFAFLRENDLKTIFSRIRERRVPPLVQFFTYAMCGVMATVVHTGTVMVLSQTLFPAGKGMLVDGAVLEEAVRKHNLLVNNCIGFPLGCIVAYVTNILFVFTPGRHSKLKEMFMFFGVAACGFFPSLWIIDFLVGKYGVPSVIAQCAFILTSFLVNFLMRKFVIFKG
jgi:putative flippase GtrA